MTSTPTATPDLAAIKQRQQKTWASGDYQKIASQIVITAEVLIETIEVHSNERVLDVATGTGNAALAAARRNCEVVGADYVPELLERAAQRAAAEELTGISWVEADAEALPFADASFDVVTSVFGTMFAPNQEQTAAEMARVVRPGGRIGLVSHTPDGFIGHLFKVIGAHVPPPAGILPPVLWGTEARLRELFGDRVADLRAQKRDLVFRYASPQHWIDFWREHYGPTLKAFEAVGTARSEALERDLHALIGRFNRATDGTMVVPNEYLEAVITTR